MAKKQAISKKRQPIAKLSHSQFVQLQAQIHNETTLRRETILKMLNPGRDIDTECKYPASIATTDYKKMFTRMGLATRIVSLWPEECWRKEPEIMENEDSEETKFEKALALLNKELPLYNLLFRADVMSGIGQYGILLLGLDDGKDLKEPVDGISETGEKVGTAQHKLLFLRPHDHSEVTIKDRETSIKNPRYGQPTMYTITYQEMEESNVPTPPKQTEVHWTRVLHLADNRTSSDVIGTPRLKAVYNNLLDVKKISGGSAEMFWRGGYPGMSLELNPEAQKAGSNIEVNEEALKEQMLLYGEGLQRYIQLTGLTVKELVPQVADPTGHFIMHIKLIAMSKGVPYRLLLGTEEAKLASSQDSKTWNARVARRQTNYLGPMVIRPFFDRLITLGVLPEAEYEITWPDLDAPTDEDISKIALSRTEAFTKYVAGGVSELIPPREYLTIIHKMEDEEVEAIEKAASEFQEEVNEDKEEDRQKGLEDDEKRASFKNQPNIAEE